MSEATRMETPKHTPEGESNIHPEIATEDLDVVGAGHELKAMQASFEVLSPLAGQARSRAVKWLLDALGMDGCDLQSELSATASGFSPPNDIDSLSGDFREVPTPRAFMSQKKPKSLVERIACLAYYLSFYRDVPHFKTSDLVSLNTEAAAPKFGNPSRDCDNADRQNGYLVTAGKGVKQITPRGEAVVQALPDRDSVSAALRENPFRARRSREAALKRSSDRTKGDK
ncbi:hypothetical protein ACFVQ0_10545 [Streptomyces sp. NPDC057900]|uniref:hypothetical protein n=1 Tax=Streptomyces sp. NPDC057900 TaxID=3346274 RepID=UPI0036ED8F64